MAQIFVSAGHGGFEDGVVDPGYILPDTTEAEEMKLLRDMIIAELRAQGLNAVLVPDQLSAAQTIDWINSRCRPGDVALEIHTGTFPGSTLRGSAVFYVANNEARKTQAEIVLMRLRAAVPALPSRGVRPDTQFPTGRAPFVRQVGCPSLLMEVIVITNPTDLALLQNQRRDFAIGIANGLREWSRQVDSQPVPEEYPTIAINVNGQDYAEPGIIIMDNAFVPIDLADRLGLELADLTDVRRVTYGNVVYIKAVDLRNYGIQVEWQAATRTVILRSEFVLPFCPGSMDRIMARGATTTEQLMNFLTLVNPDAARQFGDLPRLYREEAAIESVNYDVAFSQMLVETNDLTATQVLSQNNFGGIASATGGTVGASFPSAQIGVRAHIQHLKAYGSVEPLVLRVVDPRFDFVRRGIAPLVPMLTGRWNSAPNYGERIMAYVRRLYDSAL
jgi:N-acetylmuramoyl-L-alanine amidase